MDQAPLAVVKLCSSRCLASACSETKEQIGVPTDAGSATKGYAVTIAHTMMRLVDVARYRAALPSVRLHVGQTCAVHVPCASRVPAHDMDGSSFLLTFLGRTLPLRSGVRPMIPQAKPGCAHRTNQTSHSILLRGLQRCVVSCDHG